MIGTIIYHKKQCTNSLDWAKEKSAFVPHGTLFLADYHEKPRGRQERVWHFMPGQLLLTFVLKPDIHPTEPVMISLFIALCLGILQPLKQYNIGLKWPNDFIYKNKKVGGMLLEYLWQHDKLLSVIVGCGLNVNNQFKRSDRLYNSATSLCLITNNQIKSDMLRKKICSSLTFHYNRWVSGEQNALYKQWYTEQTCMNHHITVHTHTGELIKGIMANVFPNGDIVLHRKDKQECRVNFFCVNQIEIK